MLTSSEETWEQPNYYCRARGSVTVAECLSTVKRLSSNTPAWTDGVLIMTPDPTSVEFAILDLTNQTITVIQAALSDGFPSRVKEDWV
tara:strand:+ start:463 stop:726 length:264 start_codon:yes stop_codon:yes gene_type:complete